MSVTIAIILDTRRIKENNKYPIKLRVNYQRVNNYYPTIFDLRQEDYDKLAAPRISADLQNIKNEIKKNEREAESVIKEMDIFIFSEFEKRFVVSNRLFRQRKRKQDSIIEQSEDFDFTPFHRKFPILLVTDCEPGTITWSYREYIKKLLKEARIGTAYNYHCSYVSLKKFRGNVKFAAITTSYLIAYEQQLKERGLSK
ncbi:MAG: phage integrase SAM-like domain-containing protein, partial [Bacteroidota bacterium]|nr:phage integrase SAM-like domain-containing protein [Bacteroidota bacterium]